MSAISPGSASRPIEDALQACLDAIEAGRAPAEVLAAWPDAAEREALAPLVAASRSLTDLPAVDAERRARFRAELARAESSLYPPPAGGLLAPIPGGFPAVLLLVGAGLVTWWLLAGRGPAPRSDLVPPPVAVTLPSGGEGARDGGGALGAGEARQAGAGDGAADESRAPASPPEIAASALPPTSAGGPEDAAAGLGSGPRPEDKGPAAPGRPALAVPMTARAGGPEPAIVASPTTRLGSVARPPAGSAGEPVPPTPGSAGGPAPELAPPAELVVTGRVMDASGQAIAGALVTAYPLGAPGFFLQRSEADGRYRLRLRAGSYVFHASAQGHAEAWYDRAPERGAARVVDVAPGRLPSGVDFWLETVHPGTGDNGRPPAPDTGRPDPGGP